MQSSMESRGLNPKLREGVTTGSCAAAAAQASALRVLTGKTPAQVEIVTPGRKNLLLNVVELAYPWCGVVKDAGDDPDVTDGMTVAASVTLSEDAGEITFCAGEGVGVVTMPGLKIPPGEPAINPVPRKMIESALRNVIGGRGARVTISIPCGEEKAARTLNPRLGVVGGLSILGTTGIVRPYNLESVHESFALELSTFAFSNLKIIGLTFGSTGEAAMRKAFGLKGRCIMRVGNYIGWVLDEAARQNFRRVLLCGHPGKLLKVAAGTFDTYNRTGDGRREVLCTHAALAGCGVNILTKLYNCTTTEVAMGIIETEHLDFLWEKIASAAAKRIEERMFEQLEAGVAFINNDGKILGASEKVARFSEELRNA